MTQGKKSAIDWGGIKVKISSDMKKGLKELSQLVKDQDLGQDYENTLLLQTARLNRLTKDERDGLIIKADHSVESNRIFKALMSIIDEMEEENS